MWCSGMNSGVAGETVANGERESVCACMCVQEMARTNRKNRVTERIVTQWLKVWKIQKKIQQVIHYSTTEEVGCKIW